MIISWWVLKVISYILYFRNPLYSKIFLTSGDRSARIWSEDVKSSSIMTTESKVTCHGHVSAATWSHVRPSVLVSGRDDGVVATLDLAYHHTLPVSSNKVSDSRITDVKFNNEGSLALASTEAGDIYKHVRIFHESKNIYEILPF